VGRWWQRGAGGRVPTDWLLSVAALGNEVMAVADRADSGGARRGSGWARGRL